MNEDESKGIMNEIENFIYTVTHTHTEEEREREREQIWEKKTTNVDSLWKCARERKDGEIVCVCVKYSKCQKVSLRI